MKKLFLLVVVSICIAIQASAQTPIKYQGEVDLGYSVGVGTFAAGRINVHTIHGAKFGDYFSAGIGVGADLYHEVEMEVMVPVFLNVKSYLPTNTKVTPFASFDIGAGIGASANIKGISGMLITPAIGVKVGMFKAQLGYNVQKISKSGVSVNMNALQLKVGVVF